MKIPAEIRPIVREVLKEIKGGRLEAAVELIETLPAEVEHFIVTVVARKELEVC